MSRAIDPAYPVPFDTANREGTDYHGLTIREHYAGMAMQCLMIDEGLTHAERAQTAVAAADALIAELAKVRP